MNTPDRSRHFLDILASLAKRENQHLYIVGGTVRDFMLKRKSTDYDFTSEEAPRLATTLARHLQCPLVPLDNTPGRETYRIIVDTDLYFDFSRMQGNTIETDLRRRDFTINAMAILLDHYLDGINSVLDPLNGLDDVHDRVIRVICNETFLDDPLRMLRAFRFASTLNFSIESNTIAKITEFKSELNRVASERIIYELLIFLSGKSTYPHLVQMEKCGLLNQLLPELSNIIPCGDGSNAYRLTLRAFHIHELLESAPEPMKTAMHGLDSKSCALLKLSVILHLLPDRVSILKRLRMSNNDIARIDNTIISHTRLLNKLQAISQNDESTIYKLIRDSGEELIPALLLGLAAYCSQNNLSDFASNPFAEAFVKVYHFYSSRYLPAHEQAPLMTGDDLINQFDLKPSARFKTILAEIEESRVLGKIKTRQEAELLAKSLIVNK